MGHKPTRTIAPCQAPTSHAAQKSSRHTLRLFRRPPTWCRCRGRRRDDAISGENEPRFSGALFLCRLLARRERRGCVFCCRRLGDPVDWRAHQRGALRAYSSDWAGGNTTVRAERSGADACTDGAASGRGFGRGVGAAALAERVRRCGDERRPKVCAMSLLKPTTAPATAPRAPSSVRLPANVGLGANASATNSEAVKNRRMQSPSRGPSVSASARFGPAKSKLRT